jgi:hypothetical protein
MGFESHLGWLVDVISSKKYKDGLDLKLPYTIFRFTALDTLP